MLPMGEKRHPSTAARMGTWIEAVCILERDRVEGMNLFRVGVEEMEVKFEAFD